MHLHVNLPDHDQDEFNIRTSSSKWDERRPCRPLASVPKKAMKGHSTLDKYLEKSNSHHLSEWASNEVGQSKAWESTLPLPSNNMTRLVMDRACDSCGTMVNPLLKRGWERLHIHRTHQMPPDNNGSSIGGLALNPQHDVLLANRGKAIYSTSVGELLENHHEQWVPLPEYFSPNDGVEYGPLDSLVWLNGVNFVAADGIHITTYDMEQQSKTWKSGVPEPGRARPDAFSFGKAHGRGQLVAAGTKCNDPKSSILVFDVRQHPRKPARNLGIESWTVMWVHLCEDERTIVAVDAKSKIGLWDLRGGHPVHQFHGSTITDSPPVWKSAIPEMVSQVPNAGPQLGQKLEWFKKEHYQMDPWHPGRCVFAFGTIKGVIDLSQQRITHLYAPPAYDLYADGIATAWLPSGDLLICDTEMPFDSPPGSRCISIRTLDFSASADAVHAVDAKYDADVWRLHRPLPLNEFAVTSSIAYCSRSNVGIVGINTTIRIVAPDPRN